MSSDRPQADLDFAQGIDASGLADGGMIAGHVDGAPALLLRRGEACFIIGAECSHYHGPLAEGVLDGDRIVCPWHHACFDIRSGAALRAPALDPLPAWRVEKDGALIFARERLPAPAAAPLVQPSPSNILIIGAGAAGLAAAKTLRDEGFEGGLTMVGADPEPPYDRPNLSKDFLAGAAPDEWLPLRDPSFYTQNRIDLRCGRRATRLDPAARQVSLDDGALLTYDALLLATGAEPIRLGGPGMDLPHVFYLRTLADSRAIIAASAGAKRAVVVGASFIGLEVAASLRARDLEVHVVAPEKVPMERVLGPELGRFVEALHVQHGVVFHLGDTVAAVTPRQATLASGATIDADLIVVGVGVRPAVALAEQAGLAMDRGVLVDAYLETSAAGVYAAGDIARWPDPISGERIRVEHWVVAERQGEAAALNMLGKRRPFAAAPFFWSQHYDVTISYVGHVEGWDRTEIAGSLEARDCAVAYYKYGRKLAVATVGRDRESIGVDLEMEARVG
jgi:NADPH-dependent 2,4-dienoyl-CoA reductase/sulfur reductase-like enzyme/nitrite reductase/ring-hydroxylating ferredoxin subunit